MEIRSSSVTSVGEGLEKAVPSSIAAVEEGLKKVPSSLPGVGKVLNKLPSPSTLAVAVGVVLLAAPAVIPAAVGIIGFQAGGIAAGSYAATFMASYGGAVPAGSLCAVAQSIGATGAIAGGSVMTSVGAATTAAAAVAKKFWRPGPKKEAAPGPDPNSPAFSRDGPIESLNVEGKKDLEETKLSACNPPANFFQQSASTSKPGDAEQRGVSNEEAGSRPDPSSTSALSREGSVESSDEEGSYIDSEEEEEKFRGPPDETDPHYQYDADQFECTVSNATCFVWDCSTMFVIEKPGDALRLQKFDDSTPSTQNFLEDVRIHGIYPEDRGIELLLNCAKSGKLNNLRRLRIVFSRLGDTDMKDLAEVIEAGHLPSLTWLSIWGNAFGSEGATALASSLHRVGGSLRELDLEWNDSGTAHIALAQVMESGHLPVLEKLTLGETMMGDAGCEAYEKALSSGKLEALKHIDFSRNSIGDRGVRALIRGVQSGKVKHLVRVNLAGNEIGDDGRAELASCLESAKFSL